MKTQEELMNKYMNIVKTELWKDNTRRQERARKECAHIVEFSNGNIVVLEKPILKKDFCFGMGMCGNYTQNELSDAENAAEIARKNTDYFIEENMKQIDLKMDALNEALNNNLECYIFKISGDLMNYSVVEIGNNPIYVPYRWKGLSCVQKLSNDDILLLLAGFEEVKKLFSKRLNTYLKRYGLNKINVWTFCRN